MNVVPVLSYQVNTSCEMIAIKLTTRLRDYYLGSGGGSNSAAAANGAAVSGGRPVLILVDRNIDIASMVMHTWHYTSMVQDVLGLKDNRLALVKKKMVMKAYGCRRSIFPLFSTICGRLRTRTGRLGFCVFIYFCLPWPTNPSLPPLIYKKKKRRWLMFLIHLSPPRLS